MHESLLVLFGVPILPTKVGYQG